MPLIVLGLNHKTAPVAVRETLSYTDEALRAALADARQAGVVSELAIVSTCNRSELYAIVPDGVVPNTDTEAPAAGAAALSAWLAQTHDLELPALQPYLYLHQDVEAVRHMMRVASGLDSLVLGEPQILGQVKDAYALAHAEAALGPELERLFHHVFAAAKRVRTETGIGANPVSVASASVQLARQIFSDLQQMHALLIGAGEMITLVARHLREQGVGSLSVANRTRERAQALIDDVGGGSAFTLEEIPEQLPYADMVISCTASPLPILGKGVVQRALKKRRHKPVLLIDIAVPRDIEPEVAELDDVFLYTVDDLTQVIEENVRGREQAAREADALIDERVHMYQLHRRELSAAATVKAYRQQMELLRQQEARKALALIQQGGSVEEALERFGAALVNKIMHQPSMELKKAGAEGRHDLLAWAHELFGLNDVQASAVEQELSAPSDPSLPEGEH